MFQEVHTTTPPCRCMCSMKCNEDPVMNGAECAKYVECAKRCDPNTDVQAAMESCLGACKQSSGNMLEVSAPESCPVTQQAPPEEGMSWLTIAGVVLGVAVVGTVGYLALRSPVATAR